MALCLLRDCSVDLEKQNTEDTEINYYGQKEFADYPGLNYLTMSNC